MERPTKALDLREIIESSEAVGEAEVAKVRAREKYVPGFTKDTDPTHLTRTFLGMSALCGYYPVEQIGDSPSGEWCAECLEVASAD